MVLIYSYRNHDGEQVAGRKRLESACKGEKTWKKLNHVRARSITSNEKEKKIDVTSVKRTRAERSKSTA